MMSKTKFRATALLGTLLAAQMVLISCWASGTSRHLQSPGSPEGIKPASEVEEEVAITAAVFSQVEDPSSGMYFNYRAGLGPSVLFGASAVFFFLESVTLRLEFPGSDVVVPRGSCPLQSKTNYFCGSDPSKWRVGLVDYGAIVYENLYQGIDLIYKITARGLKYEFWVAPGADPGQIALDYVNADLVEAGAHDLRVGIAGESLEDGGLVALQDAGQGEETIDCVFQQVDQTRVRFVLGKYDSGKTLIIDPVVNMMLTYGTFFGGSNVDEGNAIAVENGYMYVAGRTMSPNFPTTAGANDTSYNSNTDAFVMKFNADGSALVYSTFLGGFQNDEAQGIAVENGFAYITGYTYNTTTNFPTTVGAYNRTHGGGNDVFVTKLSADGGTLVYSTLIGGKSADYGDCIAVENGFAYITGHTTNATVNYPITSGGYDKVHGGGLMTRS
nr:hypothetical protein [Candidatus Sigynarchaeum springense]